MSFDVLDSVIQSEGRILSHTISELFPKWSYAVLECMGVPY